MAEYWFFFFCHHRFQIIFVYSIVIIFSHNQFSTRFQCMRIILLSVSRFFIFMQLLCWDKNNFFFCYFNANVINGYWKLLLFLNLITSLRVRIFYFSILCWDTAIDILPFTNFDAQNTETIKIDDVSVFCVFFSLCWTLSTYYNNINEFIDTVRKIKLSLSSY